MGEVPINNLFAFTIKGKVAERNFDNSVRKKVNEELVFECLPEECHAKLREVKTNVGGFYVWGMKDGLSNKRNFDIISTGDVLLIAGFNEYIGLSNIAAKFKNSKLAQNLWSTDSPYGAKNFSQIFFLEQPIFFTIPFDSLSPPLLKGGYLGFTKVSPERSTLFFKKFGYGTALKNTLVSLDQSSRNATG